MITSDDKKVREDMWDEWSHYHWSDEDDMVLVEDAFIAGFGYAQALARAKHNAYLSNGVNYYPEEVEEL